MPPTQRLSPHHCHCACHENKPSPTDESIARHTAGVLRELGHWQKAAAEAVQAAHDGATPAVFGLLVSAVRGLLDALPRCQGGREPCYKPATRFYYLEFCDEHTPQDVASCDIAYAPHLRAVLTLLEHCP